MTKLLGFLLRSSKGAFTVAVLTGIAAGAGGVGLLTLIPAALRQGGPGRGVLGLTFAVVCLATVAARVMAQASMIRLAQSSVSGLVRHLCERILDLPLRELEDNDPGRLTSVLTEDVLVLTNALAGIPVLFINITVFLGCFVYLGFVSRPVLICTLVFAAPAILSHEFLVVKGRRRMFRARAEQEALVGHFRALVEGFRELKLHRERREAFLTDSIRAATARVRDENVKGLSLFAAVSGWGQLLYLGFLGFIVFGLPGLTEIPREAIAASALTVVYAMTPLDSLLNWIPVLARAGASMKRIEELGLSLDAGGREESGPTPAAGPIPFLAPIVLREVSYGYPPGERGGEGFRVGPLSLTVRPGEILFLVGGNGSGKTTLVKLLTGLYPPESGSIRIGGSLVGAAEIDAYRRLFTVVFADGFLFPSLLGLDAPDLDARAGLLLEELGLDGLVSVESGTFSTTKLSQGQRKRLSLLAACLEDRPILVLDEWASYQDPKFKRVFYREIILGLRAGGKTLIVISHDEEYFSVADRVVYLSAGLLSRGEQARGSEDPGPTSALPGAPTTSGSLPPVVPS